MPDTTTIYLSDKRNKYRSFILYNLTSVKIGLGFFGKRLPMTKKDGRKIFLVKRGMEQVCNEKRIFSLQTCI